MRLFDYLRLSFRNIRRQKLRSSLTIFAVVIGVMSVTIMLALVTGAKGFFLSQVEANGTLKQVAISQKTDLTDFNNASNGGNCDTCIKLTDDIATKVKALPHVTEVSRVLYANGFQQMQFNGKNYNLQQIVGHDTNGIIKNVMAAGRDINSTDKTGVITLTSDYADKMVGKNNYSSLIGKQVSLISQNYYSGVGANIQQPQQGQGNNNQTQAPTTITATVIGIVAAQDNGPVVGIPLEWARGMNTNQRYEQDPGSQCQPNKPCDPQKAMHLVTEDMTVTNGYSSMIALVDNSKNAAVVSKEIKTLGVGAADAKASINQQLTIFNIIGLVLGAIGGIALVVAAIGVVNTMIMAILERTREIGVMRAVGSKRSTVRRLFTTEASMLGFMGGVIGVGFGFGLTRIANIFVNKQLASNAVTARDIIGTPIWLIATVIAIATLIGMLAGLGPAARAARLDPVDALRYE